MATKHNDKIKTILLVRRCSSKVFEVLAKATNLEQVAYIHKTKLNNYKSQLKEKQIEYINNNNIRYGNIKLNDIFNENADSMQAVFITFKANKLIKVAKPLYITVDKLQKDENCFYLKDIEHFPSQSPKMYIQDNKQAYNILQNIITNTNLWEKKNTTQKIEKIKNIQYDNNNLINIIQKNHDELTYSCLFKYIFESSINGFKKFAKEVLNISFNNKNIEVIRESEQNIDLLIKSERNIIVIENKIKANVNGISERHNIESKLIQSQLKKYYNYIEKNYSDKIKNYFIFAPNYNHLNLNKYECGNNYKLIEYDKIYKFFKENKNLYGKTKYFNEVLYAIKQHTKQVDNSHEEEMHKRFSMAIMELDK